MHVLVVDDEAGVRETLSRALLLDGYQVSVADDGLSALDLVRTERLDAIVIDVMMPRMDGLETCRLLRAEGHRLPVLMLTALDSAPDRAAGLTAGADDYLAKPFSLRELLARLGALLRRPAPVDGLTLHPAGRLLRRDRREVTLSPTEYRIVAAFLDSPGQPLGRTALFEHVWGYDFGGSAILDTYLASLGRKLAALGCRLTLDGDGLILRE
jgi:two-component system response regulator MprA